METSAKKSKIDWMKVLKNAGIAVLGIITGKVAGGAAGRFSGLTGLAATGAGFVVLEKTEHEWIGYFLIGTGAGMIASPVVAVAESEVKGLTGLAAVTADAGQGAKLAMANLAQKFFLDKTPLSKYIPTVAGVSGLGNVEMSDDEATRIIQEMISEKRSEVNGIQEDFSGIDEDFAGIDEDFAGIDEDFAGVGDLPDAYGDVGRLNLRNRLKKGINMATHPRATLRTAHQALKTGFRGGDEVIADLSGEYEEVIAELV